MISRMALHYIVDIAALFARVYATLADGGRFVFSIEHPVITSCSAARPDGEGLSEGSRTDENGRSGEEEEEGRAPKARRAGGFHPAAG